MILQSAKLITVGLAVSAIFCEGTSLDICKIQFGLYMLLVCIHKNW